jgi:hypothetical protein
VKDFDEGKTVFDRLSLELMEAGWHPYSPYEDFGTGTGNFQREVRIDLKKPGER